MCLCHRRAWGRSAGGGSDIPSKTARSACVGVYLHVAGSAKTDVMRGASALAEIFIHATVPLWSYASFSLVHAHTSSRQVIPSKTSRSSCVACTFGGSAFSKGCTPQLHSTVAMFPFLAGARTHKRPHAQGADPMETKTKAKSAC